MTKLSTAFAAFLALSFGVSGHAESEEFRNEIEDRSRTVGLTKRALSKCVNTPAALTLKQRAIARRAAVAEAPREKRGIPSKSNQRHDQHDLEYYNTLSHDRTYMGYNLHTPTDIIFASNTTCALVPETGIGPYYVEGELLRKDLAEEEPGVFTALDFQFIDINTCEGVPDLLIDVWHSNATGFYSGLAAPHQGDLNTTFCRGVQQTDDDGVVQFNTIFPGRYSGRANHIHLLTVGDATVLPNGTYQGGTLRHIGRTYFDESLIHRVEATYPYTENRNPVTPNLADKYTKEEATAEYDPLMKYVYLGDRPEDGLLWIQIGVNVTANFDSKRKPASHWHPDGGIDEHIGNWPGEKPMSSSTSIQGRPTSYGP